MDIKEAQATGFSRATAFLDQAMAAEPQETQAQATPPNAGAVPAPPKTETPNDLAKPPEPAPAKPGLADAIRKDREQRQANSAAQAEHVKTKAELEALRKENEQLKALGAATDPYEFLRGRKLTKEQQAEWGQAFLYDLRPEAAPESFRLDLYKAQQARKEAEKAEAERRAQQEASARLQQEHLERYAGEVFQHIQSSTGSYPESEMWFTTDDGQVNHRVYAQSLMATADNLARAAQAQGQMADLSPANVAKVLEAEVSKRMARRDAKRAGNAKSETKQAPVAQNGKQAVTTDTSATTSADGLRSGAPLPKDMSDEARRARAAAALFGTK